MIIKNLIHIKLTLLGYVFLIASCSSSFSETFPYDLVPKEGFYSKPSDIKILSTIGLNLTTPQGNKAVELSGISWDEDEGILYAVGDEGMLYHLKLIMQDNKINGVKVIAEYDFLKKNGKRLKKKWRDSEGLSSLKHNNGIKGDTELIVSFEGKPRVVGYSPQGQYMGEIKLPAKLWRKKEYRSKNKALESVVVHPAKGVITAAEFPLKNKPKNVHTLYSSSGKEWDFNASTALNSAVTGLEVLDNGNILVLERAWAGIQNPIVINLSEIDLNNCDDKAKCNKKKLASLSTSEGWLLDNFEGLAHYKNNQYLMVSDNNDKDYQTTVLVLFEVLDKNTTMKKVNTSHSHQ